MSKEIDQLIRALQSEGPESSEELATLVGARFWDEGRFAQALTLAQADGRIIQMNDGRYTAV